MKIYVDSRNRISGSNEDFSFQLPETVDIPESLAYLDVVLVPNVFWTIRTGYNDKLYLYERKPDPILSYQINEAYRAITLPSGQYNGYTRLYLQRMWLCSMRRQAGLTSRITWRPLSSSHYTPQRTS